MLLVQVGPNEVRRNALLQLLMHIGKRDAFAILRTQQQVLTLYHLTLTHFSSLQYISL